MLLWLQLFSWNYAVPLFLGLFCTSIWAYRRLRWRTEIHWVATRYALVVSWLGAFASTGYVLVAIALSKRSTAILGVLVIPVNALLTGLLCFVISWVIVLLVLRVRQPTPPHAAAAYVARLIRRGRA